MRFLRGTSSTVTLAVLALAVACVSPSRMVGATSIAAFSPRFTANDNGSIAIFGNNLMVCPASTTCTGARAGTNSSNNNSFDMVHLDVDGDTFATFSSSSAEVVLPTDGEVRWAGLYWGARLGAGAGGQGAAGDGRQMKLRAPGDAAYRTITAGRLFGPTATADRAYQGFADVTSIVQQAGAGAYWGADVPAATGQDRYSGWSLVVVYRSPSLPLRNLTVFDGLADVGQGDPQSITITGFRTPVSGPVDARIGLIAYEGDRGSSGDRAVLSGTQLATSLSQGTNFFNGTNDDNGTLVTRRNPADRNMLGFDVKNFDAPGILPNSATSARIDLASTSERYFPGVVTTAIDVFAPDFSPSTKTVSNLTGGTPARAGDRLRYTVTFTNAGQDPAINTSIADPIPVGTAYVPGTLALPIGVTGSFDAAANTIRVLPGDFPVGRSVTFTFDADVAAAAAGTDVSNRAEISYDGATLTELQDLSFSTRAATMTVVPSADLVVTKVNTPPNAVAGETVTSTITVGNDGPNAATDVVVTDELPSGIVSVTATSTQGVCVVDVARVSCPVGTIAAGATVTVTVQAAVPPDSTAASLTDVARVSSSTEDPEPADNTAPATSDIARNADLAIAKTASPLTVTPGGPVTYTITVTNDGPSTATSVAIDDTLTGAGLTLTGATSVPAGTCSANAGAARCTIASLAPGGQATMTVDALALPGAAAGSVTNLASVSSATPDSDPDDNSAAAQVTIGAAESELAVVKTAAAASPLVAGLGEVRYTIDVSNAGPSDADPVVLSDVVPAGFVVTSASTDRGTCAWVPAPTGDVVTCNVGLMLAPFNGAVGARARVTIVASIPAGVAPGTYANVATASSPSSPPAASPPAPVTVASLANLSIVKSFPQGSDPEITPGTTETYRIRVVNDGPSVATDVVVTDVLDPDADLPPGSLTPTAWRVTSVTPPGPSPACAVATASCDLGDLPPGTTVELQLDVAVDGFLVVDPAVGVTNRATVTSSTDDANAGDNTSTFSASGGANADLSIRKIAPIEPLVAGDDSDDSRASRTFRIEIANFGPSAANNVAFTDTLPPGMAFVKIYDFDNPTGDLTPLLNCTVAGTPEVGQTVTCAPTAFDLPAFVGVFFGIEVSVLATVPDGTVLPNRIDATSDAEDGNLGNNSSTAVVSVRTEVNLRVEKLVLEMDSGGNFVDDPPVDHPEALDPLGVPAGHAVSFVIAVTNDGPSAATDVQFIDSFPPDAVSSPVAGACEFLNRETICRHVDGNGDPLLLLPGATFGVQIITVLEGDTPEGVYTNTARATTSTQETNLGDNIDTRPIEVVDPIADVIIEKAAVTSPLVAGEAFTYQIAVSAGGIDFVQGALRLSSDAGDVVVTDTLPPGLVAASATASQGSCTVTGQDVRCELGTVAAIVDFEHPPPPALVTITGTVAPDAQPNADTDIENTAVATSTTPLRGGGDSRSATSTTPLTRSADLAVTKAADAPSVAAGGGITFTVTVTNTGPSDATGIELTDLLPGPLVFAPAGSDGACGLVVGDVVCELGTVAAGTSRAITIAATLPSGATAGSVTNTAFVTSDVADPDATDDSASVGVDVVLAADLAVTKTAAAEGVLLGGAIGYTLTVANEGPSDATDVVLTESIPAGTTVVTLPGGCSESGPGTITCALGDLADGDSAALEIVVTVPDTLPPGPLANTASVSSATDDPDPSDDTATVTVEAIAQADVTLTKQLVTTDPVAGRPLEYRLTLVNNGPTVAPNASLSDPMPDSTTFVAFTASQGTCQLDEVEDVPAASCDLGRLAAGATATATLIVDTDPNATVVTNTGFGGSGGLDDVPADNEDTVTTTLRHRADLSVTKAGPAGVSAVAAAEYVIGYRNDGPSTATAVVVSDVLPAGLTPRPAPGCTISGQTVTCAVGSLAPGASGSTSVIADVDPGLAVGTALTDAASISSDDPVFEDPDSTDNTASVTSTVEANNDVGVAVIANQDQVPAGAQVSYTVVVVNNGPQLAREVVLTNQLPAQLIGLAALSGAPSGLLVEQMPSGCGEAGTTVTCDIGDLAVAQSRSFVFGGTIAADTPPGTQLVDTATVSFDGTDAVEANNSDADEILVVSQVAPIGPPPPTIPPGQLPTTGAAIAVWVVTAVALVVLGAGLDLVGTAKSRRRKTRR